MLDSYLTYLQEDKRKQRARQKGKKVLSDEKERAMRRRVRNLSRRKLFSSKISKVEEVELNRVSKAIKRIQKQISVARKLRSAIGIASFLLSAAALVYYKYLEVNIKKCKKESNRLECVEKHRLEARKKQLKELQNKKSKCDKAKNSKICKERLDKKIHILKQQIKRSKR